MSEQDTGKFNRPWEASDEDNAEVLSLPGVTDSEDEPDEDNSTVEEPSPDEPEAFTLPLEDDEIDWKAMAEGGGLEDYTTQEYQGLAEEVSRAAGEEWEQQAVAAALPGVGSGLVGFEDVSGQVTESEEDYEAIEQAASSDLTMRVASAVVLLALFLGSLLLGGWWFTFFVILVMLIALGEFYATVRTRGHKPLALFGLLGVIFVGVGVHLFGVYAIGGWVAAVTLITWLFVSLTSRRTPLEDSAITILGLAWVSMLGFAIPFASGEHPVAWVMFIVVLIALNDMGAYFVGRAFGKHPLAPKLSHQKTIEGLVGGLILAAMAASVMVTFPAWEPIGLGRALVLAAVVGVFTPLGDIVESMVKRAIDVKDMGSVLPGHGGMLDRIDGFLFALPALYFAFVAFGLL